MHWNLKPKPDLEYNYPIADCTNCGEKDVPFGVFCNPYEIVDTKYYCLKCHQFSRPEFKGYVSLIDLEKTEWDIEL